MILSSVILASERGYLVIGDWVIESLVIKNNDQLILLSTAFCFLPSAYFNFSAASSMASMIFLYPVHRHRLPDMPSLISCFAGRAFLSRRALAETIIPAVQKPH